MLLQDVTSQMGGLLSGYGDLPFADAKVFVTIYVLVGLAIVANVMNDIFNEVLLGDRLS